jgi:regulator of protease activity HflC (stomatin/prohibitin superfamily)
MKGFKEKTFSDRLQEAADARKAMLERFKSRPASDDPDVLKRREERLKIAAAREERAAVRRAQKEEEARIRAEQEAIERAEREARGTPATPPARPGRQGRSGKVSAGGRVSGQPAAP